MPDQDNQTPKTMQDACDDNDDNWEISFYVIRWIHPNKSQSVIQVQNCCF